MNSITLKSPVNGDEVPLLDTVQLAYLKSDRKNHRSEIMFVNPDDPDFRFRDRSRPKAAVLQWEFTSDVPGRMTVHLSETADFQKCRKIPVRCAKPGDDFTKEKDFRYYGRTDVYNLIPGRQYFWKITAGKTFASETGVFRTSDLQPRLISLPDAVNVRDIGGWKTTSGKRVQYGKFYRGSALTDIFSLTERGKKIFRHDLKIRTELDLRGNLPFLPLPHVKHLVFPLGSYGCWKGNGKGIFDEEQKRYLYQIFDLMMYKKYYPFYCHCAGGSDRTGTLCFLIEALLGMPDEDILADYEATALSCLGERSRNSTPFRTFVSKLNEFSGSTLAEKAVSFLFSCGLTHSMMQMIRDNMLEIQSDTAHY